MLNIAKLSPEIIHVIAITTFAIIFGYIICPICKRIKKYFEKKYKNK